MNMDEYWNEIVHTYETQAEAASLETILKGADCLEVLGIKNVTWHLNCFFTHLSGFSYSERSDIK